METWGVVRGAGSESETLGDWRAVDSRLRELARETAARDWEIGRVLVLARETRVHEQLGFGSLFEYVERLFGYSRRVTAERLRVAESLRELPQMEATLRGGERSWSAVREITRVATDETEGEWLAFSGGKTVRELEAAVSGLRRGDRPHDPPDPHLVRKIIRLEVGAEVWGLFRDAVARVRREVDAALSEEDALAAVCRRALGAGAEAGTAPYQVALTVCEQCGRTAQDAGGERLEVPVEVGERALCDAQRLAPVAGGDASEEHTHVGRPRASQTIPPATRRAVIRRDGGHCRVPGCRNHVWLDLHHLHHRAAGGGHEPANLVTLCGTHHAHHHRGLLRIEGAHEREARFSHADGTPYGEAPRPVEVLASAEAYAALRALGFGEAESRHAVAAARTHVGAGASAEALVAAALRRGAPAARAA